MLLSAANASVVKLESATNAAKRAAKTFLILISSQIDNNAKTLHFNDAIQKAKRLEFIVVLHYNLYKILVLEPEKLHRGYKIHEGGTAFCKVTGITLKKYIIDARLNAAKDYLHTSDLSVKQIAYELGFYDETLFIKFFTYHEKISPTAYRNKYFNTFILNK